jgi:hypothetical protein
MKTLLRTTSLAAALMVTSLTTAGVATTSPLVECSTVCYSDTGQLDDETTVQWETTQADCCGGAIAPCPPGYVKGFSYFQPFGGSLQMCSLGSPR